MPKRKKQSIYIHKQDEWAELYRSGMSFRQIGEREGVFYRTVQNVIKDVVDIRPKRKYLEEAKEWAELYEKGMSSNLIGEKYGVNTGVVTKYLKKMGITLRRQSTRERAYDHLTDQWIEEYQSGKSLHEIAQTYGVHPQSVHDYISPKIDMRWYTETSRQYSVDEHYFDLIESKDKAYWLGFLFASGCTIRGTSGYAIQLSVGIRDLDRIEGFKEVLKAENPIQELTLTNGNHYSIRIHSKILYEALLHHGLEGEKLDTLSFPEGLDSRYYSAFLLGFYDGRGSCYNRKSKKDDAVYSHTYVRIFGTESMLNKINQLLQRELGFEFRFRKGQARFNNDKKSPLSTFYYLETGIRANLEKLAEWFYQDMKYYSEKRDIRKYLIESQKGGETSE